MTALATGMPPDSGRSQRGGRLPDGLQEFAHDISGRGVFLVQDLDVPGGGREVAVAETVPYPL